MKNLKFTASILSCIALVACGGGTSGSSGGSNPNPPTPTINATGVNIGNIATIPVGSNALSTSVVVTNNEQHALTLQSATYTLYNTTGANAPQPVTGANSPVNATLCSTIQALGSCSVMVSVPAGQQQGQYVLTMNYLEAATGKAFSTSQIISYSSAVTTNPQGVALSVINNTLYNQPGGSTTYAVPFVLKQTVGGLVATSQNNNPAFTPTINCQGGSYTAGSLCTLYVKIANTGTNPLISGNITVSSTNGSINSNAKSKTVGIQGVTGYLFNVPVTVVQTTTGNLLTSAVNVVIDESASTSQSVTLLNNGNATITGISVVAATPITVTSNTCSSLAANASCTFNVNSTASPSGQSSVTVNYNNGATSGNTNGTLAFNVIYISPTPGPALTMTAGFGSLNNTPINSTVSENITIKNTGTVTLSNIVFNAQALPTNMTYESTSTCATNGTQSLPAGNSCTLVLKYAPTATATGTYTLIATAQYNDQGGNPQTYTGAGLAIPYSAITGNAFLYITPNYVSFAIRADGQDTATQTFTIVNAGGVSTTLDTESVSNPPVTAYASTGGTCSPGVTVLAANGGSCTTTTQFGTTTTTITNAASQMLAGYKPNPTANSVTAFANLIFNSSPSAYVTVTNVVESGTTGGNGTSATPYLFTNSPAAGTQVQITVTYTNSGTESATSFNVALNTLPVGYYQVGGTCGTGTTLTTLAPAASCTVIFAAVNPNGLYNPYSLTGALNVNIPGFSFISSSTGLNTTQFPTFGSFTPTIYVTANSLATVTTTTPTWTNGGAGGSNSFTFTGTPNGTVITIPTTSLVGFTAGSGSTCTIAAGTCSITITPPVGFPVPESVYFNYQVSPAGNAPAGITQQGSFSYSS